ncbi:MAG: N-acetylglucosamine-6-phosphate deacetylase [Candidatus Hydrogenedens sp.]|jgi:N-acetylglucosamine-6-phosphate deacetylase|nr:N-acetylglucosamine-6-phosphate deacetylase [Candidatus Hydrogenedens sp.]
MKEKRIIRGHYPDQTGAVDILVSGTSIESIQPADTCPADFGDEEALLAPGLFDMQVNGALGVDLQSPAITAARFRELNDAFLRRGVFRWMPTLVTDAVDALEEKCRILADLIEEGGLARHIPGIHLEGPFISPEDGPRGAHPAAHVRLPDKTIFDRLQTAARGKIRLVTVAPELPGALPFIRELAGEGLLVALGHHDADADCIIAAADAGARMCTHLGNGMAAQVHRHHNPLWAQLAEDRLCASLIADLEHLPVPMLEVMFRSKGAGRIVLVSDSVFLAGMEPGRYTLFDAAIEMKQSGRVCLEGTELLAGSSLFLSQAVANMSLHTSMPLADAFASASQVPAALLGELSPAWPPQPGQPATFSVYPPLKAAKVFEPLLSLVDGRLYPAKGV